MNILKIGCLMLFVLVASLQYSMAQNYPAERVAVPYPNAATPRAIDHGALAAHAATTPISVTVALPLRNVKAAEDLLQSLHDPSDAQFRQFLTAQQFAARFAPSSPEIAKVTSALSKYGFTIERTGATTLKLTGLPDNFERAFSVSLHYYEVPALGEARGYTYHAPLTHATIPTEIAGSITAVMGLDSRPKLRPHIVRPLKALKKAEASRASSAVKGNPPGLWTVFDFANYYDVQPLYDRGISGQGRTIGILTLASFTPSDAFAYWNDLSLPIDPNRITIVDVDGGPGAPSDASGSDETTMDVTQAGGVAPRAKIIVYQAPDTDQGLLDVFVSSVEDNKADSLSLSWGLWEWFYIADVTPVTDPFTGVTVGEAQAIHELLIRAAIQGQSVFAASGDFGGYEADGDFNFCYPSRCNLALTVIYPASDSAITAAGATTLAGVQELCLNAACTPPFYPIDVKQERVWGWDYLTGYCAIYGLDPISCEIFPRGSGGGVSFLFQRPFYQDSLAGVQRTPAQGQTFNYFGTDGPFSVAMPANFPGRNLPDVSFNGDPQTGYLGYYTSDVSGFSISGYWGGTSVVAPQLNGVTALLGEYLHGRVGLLNVPLYALAHNHSHPVVHRIPYGGNWAFQGTNQYNLGVGLGTLDVANFAEQLRNPF